MNESPAAYKRELELTRVFDAPRELVFRVWTAPEHLAQWWGPHGFSAPVCEVDLRPGGALRIVMRGPDGSEHAMTGVFHEIEAPGRIVFTSTVDDGDAVHFDVHTTVTLAEEGGRTRLTLRARVVSATDASARYLVGMEPGWTQSLEKLADYLRRL
ncbi:MAG TPA: SRPBCC domain-containing protein [bacterium]|nr:SRPBCC domain-containing protein [bacterium]